MAWLFGLSHSHPAVIGFAEKPDVGKDERVIADRHAHRRRDPVKTPPKIHRLCNINPKYPPSEALLAEYPMSFQIKITIIQVAFGS
jgi:hypothetical protein